MKVAASFSLGMGILSAVPLSAAPVTWGDNSIADTSAGILNAAGIPTDGTVRFTNVNGEGYDVVISTSSLNQSNRGGLGDNTGNSYSWFFEGAAASSLGQSIPYSTVTVRYYATGTNDPFYLTGTNFQFVDAEVDERFRNFSYYSAHGDIVPFATATDPIGAADPALSYSGGTPNLHFSDSSFDTGATNEGGTQTNKWIRLNLSSLPISGFTFQTGRASSNNGSVETTSLGNLVHQLQQIGTGATVAGGHTYDGLTSTSTLSGGAGTEVQLLDGTASTNTAVTVDFSLTSTSGFQAGAGQLSDVVKLQGTDGDKVVLQLSYDESAVGTIPGQTEADLFLGWFSGGVLVNAVDGNTDLPGEANTPLGHLGAYDSATDFHLGYYGVDTVNNVVWAVIDHNSEFTVVPEPASVGFLLIGGCSLALRRWRRSV